MNNWLISVPASAKKDRYMALSIVVLVLFAATPFSAGAAAPATARSARGLRSPSPAQSSVQHLGAVIRLAEPYAITPSYVGADGAASPLLSGVEPPIQDPGVEPDPGIEPPIQDRGSR
ncbi:MAG TPA: hypothetical protein VG488_08855, partial [Candidatus Angelobacter sp.]|nr:hypothetical protein [Candidatus Angelobacter sp.]